MTPSADFPLPPSDPTSIAGSPASPPPSFHGNELAAVQAWKDALRRDFESWLAGLDALPAPEDPPGEDAGDAPDLHSFYAQFAAASAEQRKANRRTAEAMSQWGETLARFESGLEPLRDTVAQLAAVQPKAGRLARAHCLVLVELLDRLYRLDTAFATAPVPSPGWWARRHDRAWRAAWTAQHQALDILIGHVDALLAREGVARIDTIGEPFDPVRMIAVAAEPDASAAPQSVVEEVAAGYLRDGELLRAAHVKVALPA